MNNIGCNSLSFDMRFGKRNSIHRVFLLVALLLGVALHTGAQTSNQKLKNQLADYFRTYTNESYVNTQKYALQSVFTSDRQRTVSVNVNEAFGMQPFTPELVTEIYSRVALRLPAPYNTYQLRILANGRDIRELVTSAWTGIMGERRNWGKVDYRGIPWVQNLSNPFIPSMGLYGRHLSLWASHGKYYIQGEHKWDWQRPHLFCTTEDLLTQSIAIPFVYPMLERAGAIVYTPRERDWQKNEVVVDNDCPTKGGSYTEENGKYDWEPFMPGFTNTHDFLTDFDDPHHEGTARICPSQTSKRQASKILWTPTIPADGNYAVYVTYPILPNAVPDAQYVVRHAGISTTIRVNQQMGGGTWVYLGTFDFSANQPAENCITLSNTSDYRGFVAGDAIRLGGGMGNVFRTDMVKTEITSSATESGNDSMQTTDNDSTQTTGNSRMQTTETTEDGVEVTYQYNYINSLIKSNVPRHLEAARYSAQWMGFTRDQFSVKDGTSDYGDDINIRPIATNYMARGSVYLPGDSGVCVPLELNLALHSDAGYKADMEYIGSLAIHTTNQDNGELPGGQSRLASRDLCDILLQQVDTDITQRYGSWARRQIYDRNYGETRIPQIPSAILEMFSHQNFADMQRALDPNFKFLLARSIYKGILRFVTMQHQLQDYVIAPLPVADFSAEADVINQRIQLKWQPVADPAEASATPTSYIVYTRKGNTGWDDGQLTFTPYLDLMAEPGVLYQFRVEAANAGGRSMPSEVLCARLSAVPGASSIFILNGFQRLASPQPVFTTDSCGFDINADPGVSYLHTTEYCGRQLCFDWAGLGKENEDGMGFSGSEMEGLLVKGNTFDYPVIHAQDFLSHADYNISSASRSAVEEGKVQIGSCQMLDVIMGAQRDDGYASLPYKTFTPKLQSLIREYTQAGGTVLVSGAYIGTDMQSQADQTFTDEVLHYRGDGRQAGNEVQAIEGMGTKCSYFTIPNEQHLSTSYLSSLVPSARAFATMVYGDTRQCAAVAYQGNDYRCIALGFPIEQIQECEVRRNIMAAIASFLLETTNK